MFSKLTAHYTALRTQSLKSLFAEDTDRFTRFSGEVAGVFVDYSKNWMTTETRQLLCDYAKEKKLSDAIHALFSGQNVNVSEARAATHWALRKPDAHKDVAAVLAKMEVLADQLKSGKLQGATGKSIDTIVHVGVGGSGLGPQLYYQALQDNPSYARCYFLTHFDYADVMRVLKHCDREKTLVIVASKSFTTIETMTMFETIEAWFGDKKYLENQCIAVTAKTDRAIVKGFLEKNIYPFGDAVGGRYSIWSAVNLANILAFGFDSFQHFLQGAHQVDQHFQETPFEKNLPVILGLLAFWYNNFFHAYSRAIVPYDSNLAVLPAYLQQLFMESLGKSVDQQGEAVLMPTGQVLWGEVGPASQHSFHQLLMQGTQMVPVDFILPFSHATLDAYDKKRAAYCLSQSQTLMQGFEGNAHQTIAGDRPSMTYLIRHFSPKTLGALLALYEHQVFVQSVLWNINAFDQWGVERGKQIAETLLKEGVTSEMDGSTRGLFCRIV